MTRLIIVALLLLLPATLMAAEGDQPAALKLDLFEKTPHKGGIQLSWKDIRLTSTDTVGLLAGWNCCWGEAHLADMKPLEIIKKGDVSVYTMQWEKPGVISVSKVVTWTPPKEVTVDYDIAVEPGAPRGLLQTLLRIPGSTLHGARYQCYKADGQTVSGVVGLDNIKGQYPKMVFELDAGKLTVELTGKGYDLRSQVKRADDGSLKGDYLLYNDLAFKPDEGITWRGTLRVTFESAK